MELCFLSNVTGETWASLVGGVGTWVAIVVAYLLGSRSDRRRQSAASHQLHIATQYVDKSIESIVKTSGLQSWLLFDEAVDCMRDAVDVVRAVPIAELPPDEVEKVLTLRRAAVAVVAIVDAEKQTATTDYRRIGQRVGHALSVLRGDVGLRS